MFLFKKLILLSKRREDAYKYKGHISVSGDSGWGQWAGTVGGDSERGQWAGTVGGDSGLGQWVGTVSGTVGELMGVKTSSQ